MKILILDDNLMWTRRLEQTLASLGHSYVTSAKIEEGEFDKAIVNLANAGLNPFDCVRALRERGISVIGHAGHKEKGLWELGRQAGCDHIASNSELTFKLPQLLEMSAA